MSIDADDVQSLLYTVSFPNLDGISQNASLNKSSAFDTGSLVTRNGYVVKRLTTNVCGLPVRPIDDEKVTLETALFPFLFPFGSGAYDSKISLPTYLRTRMKALFSPFTLYLPYLLLMYQVRKAVVLMNTTRTIAYDRAILAYKKKNPLASLDDVMKHVLKYKVPSVLHYVTRYEMQSRGSPHAHIILWVAPEDVVRVTDEIVAFIPGKFDPISKRFERFDDPLKAQLQAHVLRKQRHRCRPGLCLLDDKPCSDSKQIFSVLRTLRGPTSLNASSAGIVKDEADIETHLQSYADRNLIASEQRAQLLNKILQKRPLQSGEFEPLLRVKPSVHGPTAVQPETVSDLFDSVEPPPSPDSFTLNVEQLALVEAIRQRPRGLHVISGPPGCGKSYLLRFLHALFYSQSLNVCLFATTGSAATRIGSGAVTAHNRFSIPAKSTYLSPLYPGSFQHDVLLKADVFLGDEFSMMDCSTLDLIFFRLQQVTRKRDPLENKLLILFGDHAQLPAVCRHDLPDDEVCQRCHISRSVHWSSALCHALTRSMRHDDPGLLEFLCIIRHRKPTKDEINHYLGPCFVPKTTALKTFDADTTILCSHRDQVVDYNNFCASCIFLDGDRLKQVSVVTNASAERDLKEWLSDSYFHQLQRVAVGAKVMITQNLDLENGAANGATAEVTSVRLENDMRDEIRLKMSCHGGKEVAVRRSSVKNLYHNERRYFKATFPLMLGHQLQQALDKSEKKVQNLMVENAALCRENEQLQEIVDNALQYAIASNKAVEAPGAGPVESDVEDVG
ncbi:hypothetical protein KFL_011020025 [Klebsormidium nitens]|uniref:ATP-dependent DNA helicase n=1 Tax=Klebsormidium nitens TaxID=105231 RepID=A0A1Y1IPC4_KLENI|nr:hypothetical protein KFL_011020025 [Klebsormidium nitens]|eukprot:GAQ92710.1 hypothetical protein KFL_011020025 [Klebsormidium nitens]